MTWRECSALVAAGVVVAVLAYDAAAYLCGGPDATISTVLLDAAVRWRGFALAVVFAAGLLMGHLFLPQYLQPPK